MRLLIAEKPSVARDLARVLGANQRRDGYLEGNGLRVSWCFGHMCELEEPAHYDPAWKPWSLSSLPMIPEPFALRVRDGAKEQFAKLRQLLNAKEVEEVVNCCDAGREGELIFRYVYETAGSSKPVLRLWISSLTDQAIQTGWNKLRPGTDFDDLADAARSRSEADWLIGLNATRALTCRSREGGGGALLSLGRVQTPTLAMIVDRDRAIEAFVPEPFWRVAATFEADVPDEPKVWTAHWFRPEVKEPKKGADDDADEEESHAERLDNADDAALLAAAADGGVGVIEKAKRKKKVEKPPLLYDLTALQRRANQRYGLSAQRTLEVAQALYEKHKLITYPRTDARFLTPDQVPGLTDVVKGLMPVAPYAPHCQTVLSKPIKPGKRVVNAAEVGDHHAILPTGKSPTHARLSPDEKRVFDLVARRLLAALSADALFDLTELVAALDPTGPLPEGLLAPLRFRARGKICRQQGWRAVDPPGKSKDTELPAVEVGDRAPVIETEVKEGRTRPPKPHTDASLLRAMETAGKQLDDDELARAMRSRGLGTPATRASILQTLLDRKYVRRTKRVLNATDKGCALIDAVTVDVLKSPELTGQWEGRLQDIEEGKGTRGDFMRDVVSQTGEVVDAIRQAEAPDVVADPQQQTKALGDCPACGKPVRKRGTIWSCDSGRECPFVVFGTMAKRKISEKMVREVLRDGRSGSVKGFKSKAGKAFEAGLMWDEDKRRVGFWFEDRPRPTSGGDPRPANSPEGMACPTCRIGTVIKGRAAFGCNRWREGCDWRQPFG